MLVARNEAKALIPGDRGVGVGDTKDGCKRFVIHTCSRSTDPHRPAIRIDMRFSPGLRDAGRFAKAAFDRGRSEMSRVAQPEPWF